MYSLVVAYKMIEIKEFYDSLLCAATIASILDYSSYIALDKKIRVNN